MTSIMPFSWKCDGFLPHQFYERSQKQTTDILAVYDHLDGWYDGLFGWEKPAPTGNPSRGENLAVTEISPYPKITACTAIVLVDDKHCGQQRTTTVPPLSRNRHQPAAG